MVKRQQQNARNAASADRAAIAARVRSPYLDVAEIMEYGKFPTANAVYLWLRKMAVPKVPGRGRRVLVDRSDLDAALLREHRGRTRNG